MKSIYNKILASAAVIAGGWLMQSCNLDEFNPNQYDAGGFWNNQSNFEGNLVAMMNQMRGNYDANIMMYAGELRTDYYEPSVSIDGSALNNQWVPRNQYTNAQTQFSNYMNLYGFISNCNTYIYYDGTKGDVIAEDARNYLLGMIYGMRAWAFYQIHKMYGTGPLRVEADVILGNYDPTTLYMSQAKVSEFVAQIESDIETSLSYFNKSRGYEFPYNPSGNSHGYNYWTKAATEMLAGDFYLWTGKVSTGDYTANPANVGKAKTYLQNVANNYGYELMPTYNDAINGSKSANNEYIFATAYSWDTYTSNWFNYIMYDFVTGATPNMYWCPVGQDGTTPSTTAQRWSYYTDPATGQKERNEFYYTKITGQQRYAVKNAYWYQFDEQDQRRLTLLPLYELSDEQLDQNDEFGINSPEATQFVENFNPDDYYLGSCFVWKYHGGEASGSERYVGSNDMIYYRLAEVYLKLAEVANYDGDNANVVYYINQLRKRAYGDAWDEATYGYKSGSFAENETAILQESAKEFFQEGKRWWDMRRMTVVKGGTGGDHMVFQPQGCMGYGLDEKIAQHPNWGECKTYTMKPQEILTNTPLISDYQKNGYLVLWPLDADLLGSDPALLQTPGYDYPSDTSRQQTWVP